MAITVDIKKKIGEFELCAKFQAGDETLAILGASGCGKSMTLKCIAGIETPDQGKIVLDGKALFDSEKKINLRPQQRKTGYLFQNYALFPNMTVSENIAAGIFAPKREKEKRVAEKIKAFYLDGLEDRYPSQLSGGQQQRVAIARMLAGEPQILMLDEPLSALDSYLRWKLEQEIMETLDRFPGTALYVSHNRDEAYRICSRIATMSDGRIHSVQGKQEMFAAPQTLTAALLTGCKNFSHAERLSEFELRALDWGVTLKSSSPVPQGLRYVGFRAHFFQPAHPGEKNVIACKKLRVIEDTFSFILSFCNAETPGAGEGWSQLRWELEKEEWGKLAQSDEIYLKFPEDRIILLTE